MVLVDHEYLTGHNLQVDAVRVISFSLSRSFVFFYLVLLPFHIRPLFFSLARFVPLVSFGRSLNVMEACMISPCRLDSRGVNALKKRPPLKFFCFAIFKSSRFNLAVQRYLTQALNLSRFYEHLSIFPQHLI